jgi:hypothetical protein
MIEFDSDRTDRVRHFIDHFAWERDWSYEYVHRIMFGHFMIENLSLHTIRCMGAIGYLFTGRPSMFDELSHEAGLGLIHHLFTGTVGRSARPNPLRHHMIQVNDIWPISKPPGGGRIDSKPEHLALVGGFHLTLDIVRALVQPYEHEPGRKPTAMTFQEAVLRDLWMCLNPKVIRECLDTGVRHWDFWDERVR